MEKALFFEEDGNKVPFFVIMDTKINETTYILASEFDPDDESVPEDEGECFILKMVGEEGEDCIYEPVDDDEEFTSVAKIFEELLDEEDVSLI